MSARRGLGWLSSPSEHPRDLNRIRAALLEDEVVPRFSCGFPVSSRCTASSDCFRAAHTIDWGKGRRSSVRLPILLTGGP